MKEFINIQFQWHLASLKSIKYPVTNSCKKGSAKDIF